ncbi:hypothetical protein V5O48_007176 [Marasmius crinis-equi]|uniref:Protein kinase domain-containing protein n=1 Tax=Marasmius crinis-equi TaxID=585013 RepID=A0ABR3FHE4_9AGAR
MFEENHRASAAAPIHRPARPQVNTEDRGRGDERAVGDGHVAGELDTDQKLSAQMMAEATRDVRSATLPTAAIHSSFSAPILQSDPAPPVASSPAAMFLSAFCSPPSTPVKSILPDDEGQIVAGHTLGPVIGYGGFSTIRRAHSASGDVVAVKIVRKSDLANQGDSSQARQRLDHETKVWSSLSHEHILPLFTSVHTSYADFFITLFCPCGSLFDILKRDGCPALPQDDAGMMFRQVVRGLRYLHEVVGYVHRDLKLENVLVDETGTCKIGDFGMARKIGEILEEDIEDEEEFVPPTGSLHRAASVSNASPVNNPPRRTGLGGMPLHHTLMRHQRHRTPTSTPGSHAPPSVKLIQPGSLPYAAPELLSPPSAPGVRPPDPAQDMWALGVMLYALLTGRLPFVDSFEPRLQMKILHAVYDIPHGIGSGAERILKGCLDRNVSSRWTIAMVDEVSWGVGWGTESVAMVSDEELRTQTQSRSRSRVADIHVPETPAWDHETNRSAASADVASRRSVSRARRSLSRAPFLTDGVSTERSAERHGRRLPRASLSMSTSGSSSSSSCDSGENGDVYPVVERGRRLRKAVVTLVSHTNQLLSRSPSPGGVPKTPVDNLSGPFSPAPSLQEDDDDDDVNNDIYDAESAERTDVRFPDSILPTKVKSAPRSGIHTPSSIHSRNGELRPHPDDPRHRIYSITASPRSDLGELDDMEPTSADAEEWGTSSLISEDSVGLGSDGAEASFVNSAAAFIKHCPGPIVQSRSCEDDKPLKEWGRDGRSRHQSRFEPGFSTSRAESTPPAPWSVEDASMRFAPSSNPSRRRSNSRGRRSIGSASGLLSSILASAAGISGRSRSVDHRQTQPQFKPRRGEVGV